MDPLVNMRKEMIINELKVIRENNTVPFDLVYLRAFLNL